jgi:hypothetical protein
LSCKTTIPQFKSGWYLQKFNRLPPSLPRRLRRRLVGAARIRLSTEAALESSTPVAGLTATVRERDYADLIVELDE